MSNIFDIQIKIDPKGAEEYIRTHVGERVDETPLWVLISLGYKVLEESK